MAVDKSEFTLHISTTADLAGLANTIETLKRARDMVRENGQDTAAYDAIIKKTEGTFDAASKKLDEMSHSAHEAGVSHHEMHQALHLVHAAIGDALGPIGEFARLLGNPYVMAAAGATLAIKMLVEQHEKLREALQKQIELSHEVREIFRDAHTKSVEEASEAYAKWEDHLQHAHDLIDTLAEAMKRQSAISAQEREATEALANTTLDLYNARVRLLEAEGRLTGPEADWLTRRAQDNAQATRDARDDEAHQDEINRLRADATARTRQSEAEQTALDAAREARRRLAEQTNAAQGIATWRSGRQQELDVAAAAAASRHPGLSVDRDYDPARGDHSSMAEAMRTINYARQNAAAAEAAAATVTRSQVALHAMDEAIARHQAIIDRNGAAIHSDTETADLNQRLLDQHRREHPQQEAEQHQVDAAQRRAQLEALARSGRATRDQLAELSGMTAPAPGADESAMRRGLTQMEQQQRMQNGQLNGEQMSQLTQALEKLYGILQNPSSTPEERTGAENLRRRIGADEASAALAAGREHLQNLRVGLMGPASHEQMAEMVSLVHQLSDAQLLNTGPNGLNEQIQAIKHNVEILMQQHAVNNGATHL